MCGSDYLDNVRGVGFVVAINFFDDDYNEMEKLGQFVERKVQLGKRVYDLLPQSVDSF